uniref:Uncharacterized protein n=1 Tax=Octopus bimaculoides TaxID=37653 RepID=A0A0L8FYG7_OCTBM
MTHSVAPGYHFYTSSTSYYNLYFYCYYYPYFYGFLFYPVLCYRNLFYNLYH